MQHIQPRPRLGGVEPGNEAEAALLGSAADVELAGRLGRSRNAVRAARRRKAASPVASLRSWTPEEDALLGTMPDGELAKRLGRSAASVSRRRLKLGRAKRLRSRPWTPEEEDMVRTPPPAEAAARLGRSSWAVYSQRVRLGLMAPQSRWFFVAGPKAWERSTPDLAPGEAAGFRYFPIEQAVTIPTQLRRRPQATAGSRCCWLPGWSRPPGGPSGGRKAPCAA